jgi:hypothetical protein
MPTIKAVDMNVGNPFSAIPDEMRLLPNWVVWRLEPQSNGKATKRPYQINGSPASVMDPAHWVTFDVAFNQLSMGNYTGLGFVFTNTPYSGIDLDDAAFLADGSSNPNYQSDLNRQIKIAHEFDSYSETSPSGKGLHIIVKGKVPDGKRTNYIELYPSGRFFTMTGTVHNNKPVKDCQELLTLLWSQMGGVLNKPEPVASQAETIADEELLALARKHNTATFDSLEAGQWVGDYPSQSEADQAYLNIISYYTNNKAQVERIFRNSKLMRSKANTNKKYLPSSIEKAFDQKMPLLNLDGMKEAFAKHIAASSNGRTAAFDAENAGSNPAAVANGSVAQRLEPTAHNSTDVGSNPTTSTISLPPGLMGEIAQFVYASSPRPVPEVSLAAAIGLMAGMCGRTYNISGTGLNQYVLLLAMTGAGKEAMAEGIDKLMSEIKMQVPTSTDFIGPSEISSGSALFKYLANSSQSFVSLLGEFGLRLKQLSAVNANGAEVSLRRMILDLYNKSGHNRMLAASAYSKKEDSNSSVPAPAFSILGESTQERFYEVLNEDMISEGLLPRFLILDYKGKRVANNENRSNVRPSITLIERLSSLAAQCESINHSNPRRVINVQADEVASKFLYDFDKLADSKINTADKDVIRQLWNRAHIKLLKLAALVAVGENMIEPVINMQTVTWAAELVQNDIANLTARFEAGEIGGNTAELNQMKDMIRIIKDYATKDYSYVSKYKAIEVMHKDKAINHSYLSLRLDKMASFKNDKMGSTFAIKRAADNLVDGGKLIKIASIEMSTKYNNSMKSYYIHPSILDDQ